MSRVELNFTEDQIARAVERMDEPDIQIRVHGVVKKAAVLVPLFVESGEWYILFTRRTDQVQDHKGQVSFPGGAMDSSDRDLIATALRETEEEIGLPAKNVKVFGLMPRMFTISYYCITPVVAKVIPPRQFRLSVNEVERVFSIPIQWLAEPGNREERFMSFPDGRQEKVLFFKPFSNEILWGITARITLNLMRALGISQ